MTEVKNKGGRPRKAAADRATINFTMRLRPALHEDLRQSAEEGGRTISAEAERRLSQKMAPAQHDVSRMVTIAVEAIERQEKKSFKDDEAVRIQCRAAADYVLDLLFGPSVDEQREQHLIKNEILRRERERRGEVADRLTAIFEGHDREPWSFDELKRRIDAIGLRRKGREGAAVLLDPSSIEPEK